VCDNCMDIILSELDKMPDDIDTKMSDHEDICDEDED
jgi:hypothetical protein